MQTETNAAVDFYDPRLERTARGDTRARLRVTTTGALQLGDNHVPAGTYEILVWDSQVEAFRAAAEQRPDLVAQAIEMYERNISRELGEDYKQVRGLSLAQIRVLAKGNDEIRAELKRIEATTPDSPQAQFLKLAGRDQSPLTEVKVLERGIPEAPVAMKHEANSSLAEVLATALARTLGPALREALMGVGQPAPAPAPATKPLESDPKKPKQ
jgi:hypothetical protein